MYYWFCQGEGDGSYAPWPQGTNGDSLLNLVSLGSAHESWTYCRENFKFLNLQPIDEGNAYFLVAVFICFVLDANSLRQYYRWLCDILFAPPWVWGKEEVPQCYWHHQTCFDFCSTKGRRIGAICKKSIWGVSNQNNELMLTHYLESKEGRDGTVTLLIVLVMNFILKLNKLPPILLIETYCSALNSRIIKLRCATNRICPGSSTRRVCLQIRSVQ